MPYFNIMFWRLMTHTTLGLIWLLKMNIPRLLGSSDDKEKIGVARPEGPPLAGLRAAPWKLFGPKDKNWRDREEIQVKKIKTEAFCYHRFNRRRAKWTHRCNHREGLRARVWHQINRRWVFYTRRCIDLEYTRLGFYTGWNEPEQINLNPNRKMDN